MLGEEACSTDGSIPGLNAPAGKRWAIPAKTEHDNPTEKAGEISRSNVFMNAGGDEPSYRTTWAGAGDDVLFCDANGDGQISEKGEYVFTEWDPATTSDLEALRAVFDSNGDGKLTAADAAFGLFRTAEISLAADPSLPDHSTGTLTV